MADNIILKFEADLSSLDVTVKRATGEIAASFSGLNAIIASVSASAEALAATMEKLGQSSQEASEHIKELGAGAVDSLNLLKTSVQGVAEVLTSGNLGQGIGVIKEL